MAVLRSTASESDHGSAVFGAALFLSAVFCSVLGMKFKWFRASINFHDQPAQESVYSLTSSSSNGVYRPYMQEGYGNPLNIQIQTPNKVSPSMVQLPKSVKGSSEGHISLQQDKFAVQDVPVAGRPAGVNITQTPVTSAPSSSKSTKTSKSNNKTDKKETNESKKDKEKKEKDKREKDKKDKKLNEAKEKERKEREKKAKERIEKDKKQKDNKKDKTKKDKKTTTLQPVASSTLDSDMSRSSAPPPYSENVAATNRTNTVSIPSAEDSSGNTSYGAPVQSFTSSWDMVAQHRQNIRRAPNNDTGNNNLRNIASRQDVTTGIGIKADTSFGNLKQETSDA